MGDITIEITGADDVVSALEAMKARIDIATRAATVTAGNTLKNKAVSNFEGGHPPGFPHIGGDRPNTVTGNLQRSITAWPAIQEGRARYSVTVNPTAVYSRIIELGGTITPKEREYLSWFSPFMGRRVYKKEVTLRGWPYFRPAILDTITVMPTIFKRYWGEAIDA